MALPGSEKLQELAAGSIDQSEVVLHVRAFQESKMEGASPLCDLGLLALTTDVPRHSAPVAGLRSHVVAQSMLRQRR